MDPTLFHALPLPSAEDEGSERLWQVLRGFESCFGRSPAGAARAPGRVNLIGEHVDYEGYAVLPMAIEQSIYAAFGVAKLATEGENESVGGGVKLLSVANAKPQYKAVTVSMEESEKEIMETLERQETSWAKFVLCGVLGIRDAYSELFQGSDVELQMLVDGDIPAGCGLSSSSALVVASALATTSALKTPMHKPLSRAELAELCRQAEHRVGTMGGGMDQAVACLAQRGVALHLDFSSLPAKSSLVNVPDATAGVTFVVANSLVVAQKAVDAAIRFNKRVVECAIAAKLIAKKANVENWRNINRLVDVQKALSDDRDSHIGYHDLQKLALSSCSKEEYSISELETVFDTPLAELFRGSSLEAAIQAVIASATSFKLQQRALHVWGEAQRVDQFRAICASLATESVSMSQECLAVQEALSSLGQVMTASHRSCQTFYECSCPELDSLVGAAVSAGALGARLTGAGWGGCIVALVKKTEVSSFMKAIQSRYYGARGQSSADILEVAFESSPAPGADIFTLHSK